MKYYFETENIILPYKNVSFVRINDTRDSTVISKDNLVVTANIEQVEAYKNWLDLQLAKDLAIANPVKTITDSENQNNLTKEQVRTVIRMGWEAKCDFCSVDVEADCRCARDFEPTDEFVNKVNKILEDK